MALEQEAVDLSLYRLEKAKAMIEVANHAMSEITVTMKIFMQ